MYELANPIRIKELPVFMSKSCMNMIKDYLDMSYKTGVDIRELAVNVYVYENDDLIFLVEYIKMICNLTKLFRDVLDNGLYKLRLQGYINEYAYSNINFHNIFDEVNNKFNSFLSDQFIFDEFGIYYSEISLQTSIAMYEVFNDNIILALKYYVEPNLLRFIFNKYNLKYMQSIYDEIFNQLENVFSII